MRDWLRRAMGAARGGKGARWAGWSRMSSWLDSLGGALAPCCACLPCSASWQPVAASPTAPELVYIRFENQTDAAVSIYWLSHTGEEKLYFCLAAGCCCTQQTYEGNVWLLRDSASAHILLRTKVSGLRRQLCSLHGRPGGGGKAAPAERPTEADVGVPPCYTQRVAAAGGAVAVVAFPQVAPAALRAAADIVDHMLEGCSERVREELRDHGCKVVVIARDQVTTDVLEHSHLRGSLVTDGRSWDSQVRGLGGTRVIPTCSVGEENVLRCPRDRYREESILVHEFAHTIMEVAFDGALYQRVLACYARSKHKYLPGIYMTADAKEFWAEGSEAWFDAVRRTDVNGGVNTRARLRAHDPELAALLEEVYGDATWRYDFAPPPPPAPGG